MLKVSIHINGTISLELTPQDDLERMVVQRILASADKGQSVTLAHAGTEGMLLSVAQ